MNALHMLPLELPGDVNHPSPSPSPSHYRQHHAMARVCSICGKARDSHTWDEAAQKMACIESSGSDE
jgi:hypothetical protein